MSACTCLVFIDFHTCQFSVIFINVHLSGLKRSSAQMVIFAEPLKVSGQLTGRREWSQLQHCSIHESGRVQPGTDTHTKF